MHTVRWRIAAALAAVSLAGCAVPARTTQLAHSAPPSRAARVPAKHAVLLTGVSCAAHACTAVGWYYTSAAGPRRTLAERWGGGRWQVQRTAAPQGVLSGVSCRADACVAIGDPAQVWAGGRWRRAGTAGGLSSVSCVSATWCQTDTQYTLAERWTGVRWRVQPTPDVNRIGYSVLTAVSCAAHACLAVGGYNGAALIAARWAGHGWQLARARYGPVTGPPSVSCTAAACLVVASGQAPRWLRLRA